MKLTILGTGNAVVTKCYNTCFVIENDGKFFLVDGGGGNQILARLEQAGIDWKDVRDIFVTHKHIDHLLGIIWLVRMICQNMSRGNYEGEARIYAHEEVIGIIDNMARVLLSEKETRFIGDRFHLIEVKDGETRNIIGSDITFFDIHSTKAKQYGFTIKINENEKLTCCGDEPYNDLEEKYAKGSKWLMHEAFCLYSQADRFKPYEKHHSTAKDACELAEKLSVENIILYHTEDKNIERRKELYTEEGKLVYQGNIFVPEDLESFEL